MTVIIQSVINNNSEIIKTNILNKVNHWKASAPAQKSTMKISIATITDLENKNFGIEIN